MLVHPLVVPLNNLSNGILMLIGINRRRASAVQFHSSEELEYVIRESQEGGLLQGEARDIIRMTKPLNMHRDRSGRLWVSGTTRIEEPGEQLAVWCYSIRRWILLAA
jgi:hypothetical protein